jgi:hypothetical protein
MTSDRKKPTAGFWITVALVAVLAYPLSFGPACWISSRIGIGVFTIPSAYRPVLWAMSCNRNVAHLFNWYAKIGAPPDWSWSDMSDSSLEPLWIWAGPFPP